MEEGTFLHRNLALARIKNTITLLNNLHIAANFVTNPGQRSEFTCKLMRSKRYLEEALEAFEHGDFE